MWTWGRSDFGGDIEFEVEVEVRGVSAGTVCVSLVLMPDTADVAAGRV